MEKIIVRSGKQTLEERIALKGKQKSRDGPGTASNDAPALAKADLGIAIGAGTNVAIETADVILVDSDPQDVLTIIRLSKATYRKMVENLIWAVDCNVIAISACRWRTERSRRRHHSPSRRPSCDQHHRTFARDKCCRLLDELILISVIMAKTPSEYLFIGFV